MKRWLVVYDPDSGIAEIGNVCIVDAEDPAAAIDKARAAFRTSEHARLLAFPVDDMPDGWAFFQ